ncbi:MAG: DUF3237 domain-containing protein [Acidimicrobiales bacterium]|jgi:hypothetical protein
MASPDLVHFATMTVTLGESFVIKGGPVGTRIVAEVDTVEMSGPKISASMVGKSAADWLTVGPDGSYGTLDVRATLKTEDDEFIYMEYSGRIDLTTGKVVSAPLFQTGAEEYDWMNRMQAVGVGQNGPDSLVYELYEVVGG